MGAGILIGLGRGRGAGRGGQQGRTERRARKGHSELQGLARVAVLRQSESPVPASLFPPPLLFLGQSYSQPSAHVITATPLAVMSHLPPSRPRTRRPFRPGRPPETDDRVLRLDLPLRLRSATCPLPFPAFSSSWSPALPSLSNRIHHAAPIPDAIARYHPSTQCPHQRAHFQTFSLGFRVRLDPNQPQQSLGG